MKTFCDKSVCLSYINFSDWCTGLLYWYFSVIITVLCLIISLYFLHPLEYKRSETFDLLAIVTNWDGQRYQKIAIDGYDYDTNQCSNVAFFPAYPLAARLLIAATGCRPELALLLVAQLCLAGTFIVLAAYARHRLADGPPHAVGFTLLAFGLWPTTCFCRFAYSESPFLLVVALAFYAMLRRWPLWAIALIVGSATATRPVGVALIVPFLFHLWAVSPGRRRFVLRAALLTPLAAWGLAAYMAYLGWVFGAPLAFAQRLSEG